MTGVPRTYSIIADSTASSSSPPRPATGSAPDRDASTLVELSVQAKRVSRTYGRPKANITAEEPVRDDTGSRARILKTAPREADAQIIPESDDVDEHVPSFDGFDWRAKLKAIDEDYDHSGETNATDPTGNASALSPNDVSNLSENVEESLRPPVASPLAGLSHLSLVGSDSQPADGTPLTAVDGDSFFSGSKCTLLSSDRPSGSSFLLGGRDLLLSEDHEESGPISKRSLPLHGYILTSPEASDSESTSPKHPYAINSPGNRSSPTPPTSPFAEEPMSNEATVMGEDSTADTSKSAKSNRRSRKGKAKDTGKGKRVKAPTKKDVLESQKESARLLANQHVTIRRAQTQPVHTITSLFNKLKNAPTTLVKPESDPITSFSSPGHPFTTPAHIVSSEDASPNKSDHPAAAESSLRLEPKTSYTKQVYSSLQTAEQPAHDVSDEDMPDPNELLRYHDEKRRRLAREQMERVEASRRAKELEDHKRKALELNRARSSSKATSSRIGAGKLADFDSDDDLEIVEGMVSLPAPPRSRDMKPLVYRSQTTFGDRRVEKESTSRSRTVSQRNLELAARPTFIATQDKKGSQRQARQGASVSHRDLNNLMLQRADRQSVALEEKKKEQWVRAGGTLKEHHRADTPEKSVIDWLQKGATREDAMDVDNMRDEDEDADDTEYTPEDIEDHVKEGEENEPNAHERESPPQQPMDTSDDEPNADTDKENHRPALRRQPARVIVDSDDEDNFSPRAGPSRPGPIVLAPDTSFVEEEEAANSPGEDKENSAELAFDLSEDKENARVPRHLPRGRVLNNNDTSSSPAFEDGDRVQVVREPLNSLGDEGESPFMVVQRRDPTQDRILQVLHEEDKHSTISPVISATKGHRRRSSFSSPGSVDEHVERPKPFVEGGFSQLFAGSDNSADGEEPVPATALGQGRFSQFFSVDGLASESPLNRKKDRNSFGHRPEHAARDDDFQFTQPNTLLPSVRISESQRREVDEMFGKDQEFKLDEAKRSREEAKSSKIIVPDLLNFTPFTPSQPTALSPHSIRRPLETLSLDSSTFGAHLDASPENVPFFRGRLLRERPRKPQTSPSLSPTPRNAFDVLRDAAAKGKGKERAPKRQLEKSDFVEAEAQESDEEAMLGFGGVKGDDDDEADEDPNAIVEGLVDDAVMDVNTQAAGLVLEKHMEHQAADDAANEKLHQDAVAGRLRGKRRDRGLGFEDSDSDEEEYKGPRKPLYKKRRIEGDTLESFGQNPETRPFYNTYQAELVEDADPRLAHLQQIELDPTQEEMASISSEEELETIDSAEVRRQLRQSVKGEVSPDPEKDIQDLSWMENEDDDMTVDFNVEERPFRPKKSASETRLPLDHLDYRRTSKGKKTDTAEQIQLKIWASQEAKTYSSASGRGGFSRKEESSSVRPQKQRAESTIGKVSALGGDTRTNVKSSSLLYRMEKRKGFDS